MAKNYKDGSMIEVSDPPIRWDEGELGRIQLEFRTLQKDYKGVDAIDTRNLSEIEQHEYCRQLVKGAFRLLRLRPEDYLDCFEACIRKCMISHALEAQRWSRWGGYHVFVLKMRDIAYLSELHGKYHILPATSVVASIVVKQLRKLNIGGLDEITCLMMRYKVFEFAHASVKHYNMRENKIIRTKHVIPNWKPKTVKTEIPGGFGEMGISRPLLHKSFEMEDTKSQAGMMLKSQMSFPPVTTMTTKKITREQAVDLVVPHMVKIMKELWSTTTNDECAAALTKEIVIVLPPEIKEWLEMWSRQAGKQEIEVWVREATEDLEAYEWRESQVVQGRPAMEPIYAAINELEKLHNENATSFVARHKLHERTAMIRQYIMGMEEKWKAWAYKEVSKELLERQAAMAADVSFIRRSLEENDERCWKRRRVDMENAVNNDGKQTNWLL
ncbi:uncharacterized protein Triagg1_2140 [Trichoderma aggressivum f. europaeum]|uniref:Uncharacterized protein n=1 Tax=Trichoderma aggressivum f. europaeum TaxID=173218 RepID=A0AAE1IIL0_9HYPO|nr:hypothetical protein Triagg1_2140 [Trichoderma aggressivum f. europaeum]